MAYEVVVAVSVDILDRALRIAVAAHPDFETTEVQRSQVDHRHVEIRRSKDRDRDDAMIIDIEAVRIAARLDVDGDVQHLIEAHRVGRPATVERNWGTSPVLRQDGYTEDIRRGSIVRHVETPCAVEIAEHHAIGAGIHPQMIRADGGARPRTTGVAVIARVVVPHRAGHSVRVEAQIIVVVGRATGRVRPHRTIIGASRRVVHDEDGSPFIGCIDDGDHRPVELCAEEPRTVVVGHAAWRPVLIDLRRRGARGCIEDLDEAEHGEGGAVVACRDTHRVRECRTDAH